MLAPEAVKVAGEPAHTVAADCATEITGRLLETTVKVAVFEHPKLFSPVSE